MDKKKLIQLGIIATVGVAGLAGCTVSQTTDDNYDPADNENQDVYGPPVEDEDFQEEEEDDEFEVTENENLCVYGPPEELSNEQN